MDDENLANVESLCLQGIKGKRHDLGLDPKRCHKCLTGLRIHEGTYPSLAFFPIIAETEGKGEGALEE